ncbi:MAG TPA: Ni/Fe-hydrogenase, b-type cytochrome subunit [Desulfobulbaceae bacterium]|nr:Ni/Fe-hydrogenase, b-type cytochrome subunit [Desulfobulbaceae bacterium]
MKSRKRELREVYVWELPVRFFHWVNALCICVLCVTGFIIANPPTLMSQVEASFSYWFGIVRFIHFATAFVFMFNFIFRIYWAFVGNRYATWDNYIPLRARQWRNVWHVLMTDVLMIRNEEERSIGHNTVATLSYLVLLLAAVLQCITGFALYAQTSTLPLFQWATWITPLLGDEMNVRIVHHLLTWFFILFTVIHVYIVFYHDYIARHGLISSMIGGWKNIPEDVAEEEEKLEQKERRRSRRAGHAV